MTDERTTLTRLLDRACEDVLLLTHSLTEITHKPMAVTILEAMERAQDRLTEQGLLKRPGSQ